MNFLQAALSTGRPGRNCILLVGWQVSRTSMHERD